ncbi:UNVERIFIED_CONTAM: hypothetical protein K2H54_045644 [Gekko kuhli]
MLISYSPSIDYSALTAHCHQYHTEVDIERAFPTSTPICLGIISTPIAFGTIHLWLRIQAIIAFFYPVEAVIRFGDTKAKLEVLPFEDKELFSQGTDNVLEKICKYKLQVKSLGITNPNAVAPKTRY